MGNVLGRIRAILGKEQTTERPEREGTASATLFRCRGCQTTSVAIEMGSCSDCGDPIEAIPSESDLGFGPAGV